MNAEFLGRTSLPLHHSAAGPNSVKEASHEDRNGLARNGDAVGICGRGQVQPSQAQSYSFTKIADSGSFTDFGSPALDGGDVAFRSRGSGQEGITRTRASRHP